MGEDGVAVRSTPGAAIGGLTRARDLGGLGLLEADREQPLQVVLGVHLERDQCLGPVDARRPWRSRRGSPSPGRRGWRRGRSRPGRTRRRRSRPRTRRRCPRSPARPRGSRRSRIGSARRRGRSWIHLPSHAARPGHRRKPTRARGSTASPWPPEMQSVARPSAAPRSRIWYAEGQQHAARRSSRSDGRARSRRPTR